MATARDLIKKSLKQLGVIAESETPSAVMLSDGLLSLNSMIESWSTESLVIPNKPREEFDLVSGIQSYSIGSLGDFNTSRPLMIENALIKIQTTGDALERPLVILNKDQWANIPIKDTGSDIPTYMYYETSSPLGRIHLWPKPSMAHKLVIWSWKPLLSVLSVDDDLELPPGYFRALYFNLAIEIAGEYSVAPESAVIAIASSSKENIETMNSPVLLLSCDPAVAGCGSAWDWRTGESV